MNNRRDLSVVRLANKVALIAGAGDNMGRSIPVLFAQEGARQVVVSRNRDALAETAKQVRGVGGEAEEVQTDLLDMYAVKKVVDLAVARYGGIDIVVNNAGGFSGAGPGDDTVDAEFFARAVTNLLNTMANVCQAALPALRARGGGSIVNISSAPSIRLNSNVAYGAGKEGMIGFSRGLARRLLPDNIRVNTISPGRMRAGSPPPPFSSGGLRLIGPDGRPRWGAGLDVAYAALYLASDEAAWVTGAELIVDGGDAVLTSYPDRG